MADEKETIEKSPYQQALEKQAAQAREEQKTQARAERAAFLRGLKLAHKSDKNLSALTKKQDAENGGESNGKSVSADRKQRRTTDASFWSATMLPILRPAGRVLKRLWPLLVVFSVAFLLALYFILPISKVGQFNVSGNVTLEASAVASSSKISTSDSIASLLLNKSKIEARVVNSSARIKAADLQISAPNKIVLKITEFQTVGYVVQKNKYYTLLENGVILHDQAVDSKKIAATSVVLKDFTDTQARTFGAAYMTFTAGLKKLIRTVTIEPSQTTPDFLTLQMADKNTVKVPLSQMKEKLGYYPSIAKHLTAPETVDMEVGIFSNNTTTYNKNFADDSPAGASRQASAAASSSREAAIGSIMQSAGVDYAHAASEYDASHSTSSTSASSTSGSTSSSS
ncbi:MAG: FtsQ-type POTRA domain-containing protein [Streptococcaceae bacterium]|jgi:cell division protein FtsQ|nr:FtsQ-type POTRA domain-containing protein [Streptococcaceae bacterium]